MSASTKKGTMGAYKPRNPKADGDLYMDSATRKKLQAEKDDREFMQKSDEAYGKAMWSKGLRDGGIVKMTPKATPYKCGGKVK